MGVDFDTYETGISYSGSSMHRASTLTKMAAIGAFLLTVGLKDCSVSWKPRVARISLVSTECGPFGDTPSIFGQFLMGEVALSTLKVDHGVASA